MKKTFGDKAIREAMLADPLLRGKWEDAQPVRALTKEDHLIAKVGIGIVQTVERYYQKYLEKPNETNAKAYCLWRLRLHRRLNNDRDLLDAINEARGLGIYDEKPGPLCWDLDFGEGKTT
jgi:hypothetical protein